MFMNKEIVYLFARCELRRCLFARRVRQGVIGHMLLVSMGGKTMGRTPSSYRVVTRTML